MHMNIYIYIYYIYIYIHINIYIYILHLHIHSFCQVSFKLQARVKEGLTKITTIKLLFILSISCLIYIAKRTRNKIIVCGYCIE